MIATRAAASNCLQHLGACMLAVSILEPVSAGEGAGSSRRKRGRPFGGIRAGRGTSQTYRRLRRSKRREPRWDWKAGPAPRYNKTIPYRFVLVKYAPIRNAREIPFSRNCQREGRRRTVPLGVD